MVQSKYHVRRVTPGEANAVLADHPAVKRGGIFSCEFVKRDGTTIRRMVARTRVKKGLRGGTLSYDPKEHQLMPVYIMRGDSQWTPDGNNRRSICLDTVRSVTIGGVRYEVI